MSLQNRRLRKLPKIRSKSLGKPKSYSQVRLYLIGQMISEQLQIRMSRLTCVMYTLTHSSFSSLNLTFLAPTFSASPPWLNKDVNIDISLHESISKKNDNPELLRLISLDHINITHTHIYTLMVLRLKI